MRMFDSSVAVIVIHFFSSIVMSVNLYLIYVIWTHTPKTMGTFKWYMLKMAITDLLFTFSIAVLFLPNLIYPVPGAIAAGLLKYFGRTGALIAYIVTVATCGMMMLSVNDCCLYRIFVFYKVEKGLEIFTDKLAFFRLIADFVVLAVGIGIPNAVFQATYKELQDYAKRHNLEEYMKNVDPDAPIIAYDMDQPIILFGMVFIALFLLGTGSFNAWSNYLVQKKVNESKSSMSKETFRMQKSLTRILLAQAIIPAVSIAIPVVMYQVALYFALMELLQSLIFEWTAVLIVGAYPLVNSCFCLYSMKPYRQLTITVGKKLLFCVKWNEDAVILIEPTGTIGSS